MFRSKGTAGAVLCLVIVLLVAFVVTINFQNRGVSSESVRVYELPNTPEDKPVTDKRVARDMSSFAESQSDPVITDTESDALAGSVDGEDLLAYLDQCCGDVLALEPDSTADSSSAVSLGGSAPADNPVSDSVVMDANAYRENVKKHELYMQKEEELYTDRLGLLASLRSMIRDGSTEAELDAWAEKMRDWEKRSEALEDDAPEY